MGIIRGGVLAVVGVLFFVGLLLGNFFLTASESLEYDVVKPELQNVVGELALESGGMNFYLNERLVNETCLNYSYYNISFEGENLEVPCEVALLGREAVRDYFVDLKVDEYYYKDYECSYWGCFGEVNPPFFIVSEFAKDYWDGKFWSVFWFLLILFGIMFFFVEGKSNAFVLAGVLICVSALPFLKGNWIVSFLGFFGGFSLAAEAFSFLFSQAYLVFWRVLIFGFIFIGVGFIWKFFNLGFKVNSWFEKNKDRKLLKEVRKSKKEVKKKVKE